MRRSDVVEILEVRPLTMADVVRPPEVVVPSPERADDPVEPSGVRA